LCKALCCHGLALWIKIVEMSSICHDYVVCSNSWQFRPWILSLLSAHSFSMRFSYADLAARAESRSQLHYRTAVIAARSSIVAGSSCSRQPQKHAAAMSLVQRACSAGSSSRGRGCRAMAKEVADGEKNLCTGMHRDRHAQRGKETLHRHATTNKTVSACGLVSTGCPMLELCSCLHPPTRHAVLCAERC
jgi:hypothetical protein